MGRLWYSIVNCRAHRPTQGDTAQLRNGFLSRAGDEVAQADAELGQMSEHLIGLKRALAHTTVHPPTARVVKDTRVTTISAIIYTGQVIMEIHPQDDDDWLVRGIYATHGSGLSRGRAFRQSQVKCR